MCICAPEALCTTSACVYRLGLRSFTLPCRVSSSRVGVSVRHGWGCWTRAGLGGSGLDLSSARGSLYFLSLCLLPSLIHPSLSPSILPSVGTTRVTRGSVSHTYFSGFCGYCCGNSPEGCECGTGTGVGVRECLPFRNYRTADTIAGAVLGLGCDPWAPTSV